MGKAGIRTIGYPPLLRTEVSELFAAYLNSPLHTHSSTSGFNRLLIGERTQILHSLMVIAAMIGSVWRSVKRCSALWRLSALLISAMCEKACG